MFSKKTPSSLPVKVQVRDLALEVPTRALQKEQLEACVHIGRRGYANTSRRTKWFSVWSAKDVPAAPGALVVAADTGRIAGHRESSYFGSDGEDPMANRQGSASGPSPGDPPVTAPVSVLEWGALNHAEFIVTMKMARHSDGSVVFEKKLAHPLVLSVEIRTQVKPANVALDGEAAPNVDDVFDEEYSDYEADADRVKSPTHEQRSDGASKDQQRNNMGHDVGNLTNSSRVTRVLPFPLVIDVAEAMNLSSRRRAYAEVLVCPDGPLKGAVLRFTLTAEHHKDEKAKQKEAKQLMKEREKQAKKEARVCNKEQQKRATHNSHSEGDGEKGKRAVGTEVSSQSSPMGAELDTQSEAGTQHSGGSFRTRTSASRSNVGAGRRLSRRLPTMFPIELRYTPFPFFIVVDNFAVTHLSQPVAYYRGLELRLASHDPEVEVYPVLDMPRTRESISKECTPDGGGGVVTTYSLVFPGVHLFLADERLHRITGYDSVRALVELEKTNRDASHQLPGGKLAMFREEFLKVGEKYVPLQLVPSPGSACDAQCVTSKDLMLAPYLRVPAKVKGLEDVKTATQRQADRQELLRRRQMKEQLALNEKAKRKSVSTSESAPRGGDSVGDDTSPSMAVEAREGASENGVESTSGASCASPPHPTTEVHSPSKSRGCHRSMDTTAVSSGTSSIDISKTPAKQAYSDKSKLLVPVSRLLRLSDTVLNQERFPRDGLNYYVRYDNNEQVSFRIRRFFIPSCCEKGESGSLADRHLLECEYLS